MRFLTEKRINIGINNHAGPKQRHGVLWIEPDANDPTKNCRVPVIIDMPFLVAEGLNYSTWRRVKKQIEKMGINATHFELDLRDKCEGGGHYCYSLTEYKELYSKESKGRPIYTNGFA